MYWHEAGPKERMECGMAGYEWVTGSEARMTAQAMTNAYIEACDLVFDNWQPIARFNTYKVQDHFESKRIKLTGIELSYE